MTTEPLTVVELAQDFRRVGISNGDALIVHSSFRSLGHLDGGPNAVIDALLSAVGPSGHLLLPAFTFSLPAWNMEPFDVGRSKSRVGAITEVARTRPDFIRSFHPTHSVLVHGPDAAEIARNHLHSTPLGLESPFGRMERLNAKILMLGTYQDTNSSLHYCEVVAGLPYVQVAFSENSSTEIAWFINAEGAVEYTEIREVPGCSRGFRAIEQPLRESGVLLDVQVGRASSQLLSLPALVAAAKQILAADPTLLLCHNDGCLICTKRRRFMKTLKG